MKNKKSSYQLRLAKRKQFGKVRLALPVDASGQITLNRRNFVRRAGKLVTRVVERLARMDEVKKFA